MHKSIEYIKTLLWGDKIGDFLSVTLQLPLRMAYMYCTGWARKNGANGFSGPTKYDCKYRKEVHNRPTEVHNI